MGVTILSNVLQRLGLGVNESKIYVFLYSGGQSTASQVAKGAAIPRTKCYVCLRSLVGKGFVFEIPSKPKEFKSVPIETLQSIVIDQNKRLSQVKPLEFTASPVFLTLGQKNVMRLFPVETSKCKTEIISLVRGLKNYPVSLNKAKRAVERGVDMKILSLRRADTLETAKTWRSIGVRVKLYKKEVPEGLRFTVFDGNLCRITLGRPQVSDLDSYTTIWIKSKPVAVMLKEYFYLKWKEAVVPNVGF